jgi:hypothetical protein
MLSVALLHWPCLDKNGNEIATAITNLDLHDCARVCLTYGINTLYIVHPNRGQLDFAGRITEHWLRGFGGQYNPSRKRALEIIRLAAGLDEVKRQTKALMVGTSARTTPGCITWSEARVLAHTRDTCLLFGTGWGISPRMFEAFDAVVEPIAEGETSTISLSGQPWP